MGLINNQSLIIDEHESLTEQVDEIGIYRTVSFVKGNMFNNIIDIYIFYELHDSIDGMKYSWGK